MVTSLKLLTAGIVFAAVASAAEPVSTADALIAKHIEAKGGAAALKGLQSLKRTGKLKFPGSSFEMQIDVTVTRKGQYRGTNTLQGMTAISAFDGTDYWSVSPFGGRKEPQKRSAEDAKQFVTTADIDGAWIDAKAKGHQLQLLPMEEVEGSNAYRLRVLLKNKDELTVFFDADSFMVLRTVLKQTIRGDVVETETDYGDYEKVNGVFVAMSEERGPKDSPSTSKSKSIFTAVEANGAVAEAAFAFPKK
jgi:hypothetical protein